MVISISNKLHFGGVGPLAAITASAVAVMVWKKQAKVSEADLIAQKKTCNTVLTSLWVLFEVSFSSTLPRTVYFRRTVGSVLISSSNSFQSVLFSLIGTEIRLEKLQPATVTGGLLTLVICLTIRTIVTFFAVSFSNLTVKEKLFVCIGWLPKASVQAALAPTAMDMVRAWTDLGKPLEESALSYSETVSIEPLSGSF